MLKVVNLCKTTIELPIASTTMQFTGIVGAEDIVNTNTPVTKTFFVLICDRTN